MRNKNRFHIGVVLATGEEFSFDLPKLPKHYCSWIMQQLPYGTTFTACSFFRERISA